MGKSKSGHQAFFWNSLEKFGIQAIQFVIGIQLARILSLRDYGLIALLLVFTAVSQIFIDSGFTKALIQRNDKSKDDLSTAFTFNLAISITIYGILWFTAPYVASFYNEPVLIDLLRVLAFVLIINALFAIPNTLLTIDLEFRTIATINSVSMLISGVVAIILAYNGFGVWSLVIQYLLKALISLLLFTLKSKWNFRIFFSKSSFKNLFSFGSNLMISSLLNVIVGKFSSLFIAKVISTPELGVYSRGAQFPDVAIGTLGSVLDTVLLPMLAKNKNPEFLRSQMQKIFRLLNLVTIPITVLLAVLAEPIVVLLLTEKWLGAVPILQLFCISRFFNNLISVNVNSLYVLNRAELALKQHYGKIAVRVVLVLVSLQYGIVFIALAEAVTSIIHFIINAYYPGKLISYGIKAQLKDLVPYLLIGSMLFGVLYLLNGYFEYPIWAIIFISIIGIVLYIVLLFFFRKSDFLYAKDFISSKISK